MAQRVSGMGGEMTICRMVLAAALAGTAALAGEGDGGAQSAHAIKIGGLFTARLFMVPETEQFYAGPAGGPDQAGGDAGLGGFAAVDGLESPRKTDDGALAFSVAARKAV